MIATVLWEALAQVPNIHGHRRSVKCMQQKAGKWGDSRGSKPHLRSCFLHHPMTVAAFHLAGFSSGRPQYSFCLYSCITMSLMRLPMLETKPMENSRREPSQAPVTRRETCLCFILDRWKLFLRLFACMLGYSNCNIYATFTLCSCCVICKLLNRISGTFSSHDGGGTYSSCVRGLTQGTAMPQGMPSKKTFWQQITKYLQF